MWDKRNRSRASLGVTLLGACFLGMMWAVPSRAGDGVPEPADRTLSPFFFVASGDPQVDRMPLKATSADVRIAGVIADVTVNQVYRNEGTHALEAIYVFPCSSRAAVHAMTMTIGTRTITAVIRERQSARAEYEQARTEGRAASLLEQQRPNVFQMNVANIMPGDEIKVRLSYTELLIPTAGVYEFVFPTVVGPRYSNRSAAAAPDTEHWVENPYRHQGEEPDYDFDITVTLAAGMPIRKVSCPSHRTSVRYDGPSDATVVLDRSESRGGNRDFVLRYGLAGSQVGSGLLLYRGDDGEDFFLLMVEPPARVEAAQIPPREYIFVVDVSGSMHGFPIETSKRLLADLISHLRPTDSFNVLLFSGGSRVMSERSLPATPENLALAVRVIDREQGGGGTELLPALRRALALPRVERVSRTVVIATDGYVAVEKEAFDLIRANLARANVFAFGIGSAVNRFLIEGIARAGMGEPFVVAGPEKAASRAEAFREYVASPVLTQITIEPQGFDAFDVEPPSVPDVLAERPVMVFGKWRGRASGRIAVRGLTARGPYFESFDAGAVKPERGNEALRYLWARHRIATLGDYARLQGNDATVKEITALGLAYNLLTDFTSFVAVDRTVRNRDGRVETVTQPLPLPQGVSDLAVGKASVSAVAKFAAAPQAADRAVAGVAGGVPSAEEVAVQRATGTAATPQRGKDSERLRDLEPLACAECRALEAAARAWRFPAASGPSTVTVRLASGADGPRILTTKVDGPLSQAAAERAVRERLADARACIERATASGARLVLVFLLRADGSVDHLGITASSG